ncbi:OB-fold protein [Flagellimonas eckloniae]|nr:hypothetical protein [Allomuricauda eckloniae]
MLGKTDKFLVGVLLLILSFGIGALYIFNKPDYVDLVEAEPELFLNAETLLLHFAAEDETFLKAESIIEFEGAIKEINTKNERVTVLLEGNYPKTSIIICDMQPNQKEGLEGLGPTDTIRIKGIFKGFLKDAVFLNCVITDRKTNE